MQRVRQNTTLEVALLMGLTVALAACGGRSEAIVPTPPPSNPTPSIPSLSPASAVAGSGDFTLTVTGSGFNFSTVVLFGLAYPVPTSLVTSTQVTAAIPSSLIGSAGYINVYVQTGGPLNPANPAPLQFRVNNPAPQISSVVPDTASAGAAPLVVTINCSNCNIFSGPNFDTLEATLLINGSPRQVNSFTDTQLVTTLSASDLATAGTISISVVNPDPTVGPSNQFPFTVTQATSNPQPTLVSASDASVPQGWPGFPLTVYGTGFVAGSVVQWGGLDRQTTAVSSTELQAAIPASDLTSPGTVQVSVTNPSPGGGTTNTLPIQVQAIPSGAIGVIDRSDIGTGLTQPTGDNVFAAISADGRYVVFQSDLANPSANPSDGPSLLLRDTCIGAPDGCVPSVTPVPGSPTPPDSSWNDAPYSPTISANGRFIEFSSSADFVLYDTCLGAPAGCVPADRTIYTAPDPNAGDSVGGISLSADGRFAASIIGVFGCNWANAVDGGRANAYSEGPTISTGGRYVAFVSSATNLVAGLPDTSFLRLYLRDLCTGAPAGCVSTTTLVLPTGEGVNLDDPSISADGRFIAFASAANDLVAGDTNGASDVFVHDTCIGVSSGCTPSTVRVSVALDGTQGNGDSGKPVISADGRFVVFISAAKLAPGAPNALGSDVYVARH